MFLASMLYVRPYSKSIYLVTSLGNSFMQSLTHSYRRTDSYAPVNTARAIGESRRVSNSMQFTASPNTYKISSTYKILYYI